MSGFYHIRDRRWSEAALHYAGIAAHQLADVAAGAHIGMPISPAWRELLSLDAVPVYSCGNDQSCSAAGAGLREHGDILCNFGTAMIVYALRDELPTQLQAKQISGISPITGRYFLLALENECGNVLDWAHRLCYADQSFSAMLFDALSLEETTASPPQVALPGGGRIQLSGLTVGSDRRDIVRALLEYFATTFGELLSSVREGDTPGRLFAAGGLSRSSGWLDFISQRYGLHFERTVTEQPGLVGVARIIKQANEGG
jgi:sugar (pentulose or hexulose) kinase